MQFKDLFTEDFKVTSEKMATVRLVKRIRNCKVNSPYGNYDNAIDYCTASYNKMRTIINPTGFYEYSEDKVRMMLIASIFAPLMFVCNDGEIGDMEKEASYISNKVRTLFYEEPAWNREAVCYMIRHLPDLFTMRKNEKLVYTLMYLSHGRCDVKTMVYLYMSVCCGNNGVDKDYFYNLAETVKMAKDIKCYTKPYEFDKYSQKNDFFYMAGGEWRRGVKKTFTVYFMIGLPGAGKDTYIAKNLKRTPSLSRDAIRTEIGIKGEKPQGTKKEEDLVTKIMNERIIKYCEDKVSFIINNTNLKKRYRDAFEKMILPYNPKIVFIYIEAPTVDENKARRNGQIDGKIIDRMYNEFDFPEPQEYDKIIYILQRGEK